MRTLVLNQTNLVADGQNNKLVYNFPNSVKFSKAYLAVSSISMYYSWFNISNDLKNNTFSYTWVVGGATTTYTIVIPDGLYEVSTLNQLLQFNFLNNNHYLLTSTGQVQYYAEFVVNPSRYAVQINTFLFPTSLPSGYSTPTTWAGFPTQSFNPSIVLPININNLLGYVVNFTTSQNTNNSFVAPAGDQYVSKNSLGTISYISTTSPNLQPNSSILISSSGINNPYAQPTSIIYSLTPSVAVGQIVSEKPPEFMWNELIDVLICYTRQTLNSIKINISTIKTT